MNNIIKRKWNQNSMVIIEDLQGMAFQAESGGHTFQISGIDGEGNAVALSGTPAGVMLRADGQDVALTCSVSGGIVSATLPANAYVVPGRFGLTIFLTSDGQKTAIYAAVGTVGKTSSGTVAPPAGSDVVDLVNAIAAAVATIPASYTDLMASVAPTYSSSGLYAVGSYAWYNGKLYRCTTPITSGETWTSGHWTLANIGSDLVDLKSAFEQNLLTSSSSCQQCEFRGDSSGVKLVSGTTAIASTKRTAVNVPSIVKLQVTSGYKGAVAFCSSIGNGNVSLNVNYLTLNNNDFWRETDDVMIVPDGTAAVFVAISKVDGSAISTSDYDKVTFTMMNKWLYEDVETLKDNDVVLLNKDSMIEERLSNIDGIKLSKMEIGTIAMSSSSISFNASNTVIRTPQGEGIRVSKEDIIGLSDYTNAKYKYCVLKDSDNKYEYVDFTNENNRIKNNGILYVCVEYADEAKIHVVAELASLVRIYTQSGSIYAIDENLFVLNNSMSILTNRVFDSDLFGVGTFRGGSYIPTLRPWRVSTKKPLTLDFPINIKVKTGYDFYTVILNNGTWTESNWITEAEISANTTFAIVMRENPEPSSGTANVNTFINNIDISTNQMSGSVDIDSDAIEDFMELFYSSNKAESYAFFTDPHLMGNNGTFNEKVFNEYIDTLEQNVKRTSAAYVVCGGDWLNLGDTPAQASVKLGFVDGQMRSRFPGKYFPIAGNHDFNITQGETPASGTGLNNMWFHEYHNVCYYKFKQMLAQNYVLNTKIENDTVSSQDKTMLDWLAANLIEDDPAYSTIMFHIFKYISGGTEFIPKRIQAVGEIISAFNGHTVCTLTSGTHGYDKTYDFTGTTGHIDYVLVGHLHTDFVGELGGVPVVGTTNMQDGGVPTFDLVFADYTARKLYMTRIGTGNSRTVNI